MAQLNAVRTRGNPPLLNNPGRILHMCRLVDRALIEDGDVSPGGRVVEHVTISGILGVVIKVEELPILADIGRSHWKLQRGMLLPG